MVKIDLICDSGYKLIIYKKKTNYLDLTSPQAMASTIFYNLAANQ